MISAMTTYLTEGAVPLDPEWRTFVDRNKDKFDVRDRLLYKRVVWRSPLLLVDVRLVPVTPITSVNKVL